jgi:ADP-ribosylglycohydrolase
MKDRLLGVLLGTAVGDAIGLPREGLSPRRAARLFPGPLRHRLGLVSDDTEHACMTAQALLATTEPVAFTRGLRRRLRWWLAALPPAIGWGTLRALCRAWLGISPSGVWSAGNGPAMRAPILGACIDDRELLARLVSASTAITHRDPRAQVGALAIALTAHHAVRASRDLPAGRLRAIVLTSIREIADDELARALDIVEHGLGEGQDSATVAAALGQAGGVSGYIHHTVPLSLSCWLRAPHDVRAAVTDVISLGGDADTTGAIVGALAGGAAGAAAIPQDWLAGIVDWPYSTAWIRRLAGRLGTRFVDGLPAAAPRLWWPALPLRNAVFGTIVLATGLRRLLPPW